LILWFNGAILPLGWKDGVGGKAFAAHQTTGNALRHHTLEDATKEITVAKLAMPQLLETRMMSCCRFRGHEDKIVTKALESGYDETEVQP